LVFLSLIAIDVSFDCIFQGWKRMDLINVYGNVSIMEQVIIGALD
jgi:hypothetical protein